MKVGGVLLGMILGPQKGALEEKRSMARTDRLQNMERRLGRDIVEKGH